MDNEQESKEENKGAEEKRADDSSKDGISAKVDEEEKSPIDEAKKVLAETKETLTKITEERKRLEKATAEMLVNGRSLAGKNLNQQPTIKDKAAEFFKGTAIEKAIQKHG